MCACYCGCGAHWFCSSCLLFSALFLRRVQCDEEAALLATYGALMLFKPRPQHFKLKAPAVTAVTSKTTVQTKISLARVRSGTSNGDDRSTDGSSKQNIIENEAKQDNLPLIQGGSLKLK